MACGALCALAWRASDPGRTLWLFASAAAIVVALAAAAWDVYIRSGRSVRAVVVSPLSLAALTWLALFVYRPLQLRASPGLAARGLAAVGFQPADLTRTVALGGVGISAWCLGYLIALGRTRTVQGPPARRDVVEPRLLAAIVVIAVGTVLWFSLFLRQGGFGALSRSAASLRANQGSSFWGFIGVWMIQGTLLYAFTEWLRSGSRRARLVTAVCVPLAVAAAVAVQLRSLIAICGLAALAIYLSLRQVSRRRALVAVPLAVLTLLVLAVTQQIREYTINASLSEAIRLTAHTPLSAMSRSDLSTFDHFVAMERLVPGSIPYLDGRSLVEIPEAVVPRTLWSGKPPPLDVRVGYHLYPNTGAGIPISMQGELYWNGGLPAVALGALALGVVFGAVARFGLRARPDSAWLLLYAVLFAFTHHLLTRGLATMFENVVFAVVGTGIAYLALAPQRPSLRRLLHAALRKIDVRPTSS